MKRDATFDETGCYRYRLTRRWADQGRAALFLMLNPSTADAEQDDPTVRRCIGFAARWRYPAIDIVNLFAYRATNPEDLVHAHRLGLDVIGPRNDGYIQLAALNAGKIIAAWGRPRARFILERAIEVERFLSLMDVQPVECIGITQNGDPRHPLYTSYNWRPTTYRLTRKSAEEIQP